MVRLLARIPTALRGTFTSHFSAVLLEGLNVLFEAVDDLGDLLETLAAGHAPATHVGGIGEGAA